MFRKAALIALLSATLSAEALAQTSAPAPTPPVPVTAAPAAKLGIEVELAPVFSAQVPARRGERISTSENSRFSIRLVIEKNIDPALKLTIKSGLNYTEDFQSTGADASSLSSEFRLDIIPRTVLGQPYVSYKPEIGFSDLLDTYLFIDHPIEIGSKFQVALFQCAQGQVRNPANCGGGFYVTPSLQRLFSDSDLRERITPKVHAVVAGVFQDRIKWRIDGSLEYRIFLNSITPLNERQRDLYGVLGAGVDLAPLLSEGVTDSLFVGVRAVMNRSNFEDPANPLNPHTKDYVRLQLVPIVRLRIPL